MIFGQSVSMCVRMDETSRQATIRRPVQPGDVHAVDVLHNVRLRLCLPGDLSPCAKYALFWAAKCAGWRCGGVTPGYVMVMRGRRGDRRFSGVMRSQLLRRWTMQMRRLSGMALPAGEEDFVSCVCRLIIVGGATRAI